jgi:hypothetical protein
MGKVPVTNKDLIIAYRLSLDSGDQHTLDQYRARIAQRAGTSKMSEMENWMAEVMGETSLDEIKKRSKTYIPEQEENRQQYILNFGGEPTPSSDITAKLAETTDPQLKTFLKGLVEWKEKGIRGSAINFRKSSEQ